MHTIVIRVWRGLVSEVYSDDPNTEIVILDEDRTDVEDIPQIELPRVGLLDQARLPVGHRSPAARGGSVGATGQEKKHRALCPMLWDRRRPICR